MVVDVDDVIYSFCDLVIVVFGSVSIIFSKVVVCIIVRDFRISIFELGRSGVFIVLRGI